MSWDKPDDAALTMELRDELAALHRLVRQERALIRRLERWLVLLLAVAGLMGCDTALRVVLWVVDFE